MLTIIKCISCGGMLTEKVNNKYYCPYCDNLYVYNPTGNSIVKSTMPYVSLHKEVEIKSPIVKTVINDSNLNKAELFSNNFMLAIQAYEMRNLTEAHRYCSKALLYDKNNKRATEFLNKIVKATKRLNFR